MKYKMRRLLGYCIMMIAFGIPLFAFGKMVLQSATQVQHYQAFKQTNNLEQLAKQIEKSYAYNNQLSSDNRIVDPFLSEEHQVNYDVVDDYDAIYGYLSIPSIEVIEPIYLGADAHHLAMGLAHVAGTPLPVDGQGVRSVIAGHRMVPDRVSFRHLDKLQVGDALYYDNGQEIVEYRMIDSEIILPSEWEKLEPASDKNIITLITCDPIPLYNKRLLVNFERVAVYQKTDSASNPSVEEVERLAFTKEGQSISKIVSYRWFYRAICIICLVGILVCLWRFSSILLKNKNTITGSRRER